VFYLVNSLLKIRNKAYTKTLAASLTRQHHEMKEKKHIQNFDSSLKEVVLLITQWRLHSIPKNGRNRKAIRVGQFKT
jgi:hypothetical protein